MDSTSLYLSTANGTIHPLGKNKMAQSISIKRANIFIFRMPFHHRHH